MAERNRRLPNPLLMLAEARSVMEAAALIPAAPFLLTAPKGDGHHVIVVPPFGAGDAFATVLRTYLGTRGYVAHKWARREILGLHQLVTVAVQRLREVCAQANGNKVSLVGHSLGGIYAREIARSAPEMVRCVITVGSPFAGDMKANYVWPMYEAMTGTRVDSIPTSFLEQMNEPPPVPSTAMFSRTDGVASWWCCVDDAHPESENIEVPGSHIGLLHNPLVFYVVADRLAQPEGEWQPFQYTGLRRLLYRSSDNGA
jgi:pimeloyl-ACP methyl ester carboxylesterase